MNIILLKYIIFSNYRKIEEVELKQFKQLTRIPTVLQEFKQLTMPQT
jgi:hypothetical protein